MPEAVYKLKDAKIKVVMLTGDKQETAISIGRRSLIIGANITDKELMCLSAQAPCASFARIGAPIAAAMTAW